jgi:hypothetical protein
MMKRSVAQNADKAGDNDVSVSSDKAVKFVSTRQEFFFSLKTLDENGNHIKTTNADGNNAVPQFTTYQFVKVAGHRDQRTGKIDPSTAFCFFIVDPETHGKDYSRILDELNRMRSNPIYQLYNDDEYFKQRNPEAYRIAKEKEEIVDVWKLKVEELEKKLGFNRPKQ